MIDIFKICWD